MTPGAADPTGGPPDPAAEQQARSFGTREPGPVLELRRARAATVVLPTPHAPASEPPPRARPRSALSPMASASGAMAKHEQILVLDPPSDLKFKGKPPRMRPSGEWGRRAGGGKAGTGRAPLPHARA